MNLPTCNEFCTASKCQEIEERLGALEQSLELLKASFDAHVIQNIPEAHDYTPTIKIEPLIIQDHILIIDLTIDNQHDIGRVDLKPSVGFDIVTIGNNSYEFKVTVNGQSNSDILTLTNQDILDVTVGTDTQNEIYVSLQLGEQFAYDSTPLPNLNVSVDVFDQSDEQQIIKVQVGNNSDEDILSTHKKSNLSLYGSFQSEILTLTVADGESYATTQIGIPTNNITNIDYGGGGDLNCPNIETKIDDCCNKILNAINISQINLTNEINNTETVIVTDVSKVKDAVCIDITGTTSGDYSCEFEADEEGNIIPTYAVSKVQQKTYQGKGFGGIHEILKLIQENLTYLHSDVCKAVDPIHTITLSDIYNFCNDSQIQRSDYPEGIEGDEQYQQAIKDYLQALLLDTKYGYLIEKLTEENPTNLITAPDNWANFILTDFALIQSRINREAICNIDLPENPDVVTLVASEKELHRVNGKQLILHFVTLENYPKRSSSNSSYRPIQIPAPQQSYDWVADFQNLRWQQGNQYAELVLEGWKHGVSGWFSSVDAANAFFDAVLNLTTAVEINRLYPVHKTPKTNILVRETRPYRAFISEIDDQGNARTLTKYFPPPND